VFDPQRWGIPIEKIKTLGPKLGEHWQRFRQHYKSKTRDTSEHALAYMQGQMTMVSDRNFAGIANSMEAADGQALQHFMSNSPWSGQGVFEQIREEIKEKPELHHGGSVLILDEYADEKAGGESAGTLRQYNGRMGMLTGNCSPGRCGRWSMPRFFCQKPGSRLIMLRCARKLAFRRNEHRLRQSPTWG
jgi:hypothetical protein